MQWTKIDEVLFFQEGPGVRNTQYTSAGVKLLNVANLVDGKVDLSTSDRYISEEEAYGKYKHFLCDEGDFIVASSGIKVEYIDKKMGFIEKSMLPLCMNTSTIRFKVKNPDILRIRYFMYYLKSQHFKSQLARYITGSAQLNYGPSHLKKMVMPLASIDKQDEIVEKLDCLQNAINIREQQLAKLDELVKARFIEMFGDPEINPYEWECLPLSTLVSLEPQNGLYKPQSDYVEDGSGVPILRIDAFYNGKVTDLQNLKRLICSDTERERYLLRENDIVINRVNSIEYLGKCAHIRGMLEDTVFESNMMRFHLKESIIDAGFAVHLLCTQYIYKQILSRAKKAVNQASINQGDVMSFQMLVPPLTLQKQFVMLVEQVDKSKLVVQQSIEKLETLKKSLMQQYFG